MPFNQKVTASGRKIGRPESNPHHCHTCNGAVKEPGCYEKGHVAFCEVPKCGLKFNTEFGCTTHPYADAYNLEAKAKNRGCSVDDLINSLSFVLDKHTSTNGTVEEKMAALRIKFDHDMEPVQDSPEPAKKQPSKKEGDRKKFFNKFGKTSKNK